MTKPPETFGTQYANFTRSGSSLISSGAVKCTPLLPLMSPSGAGAWLPLEVLRLFAGIPEIVLRIKKCNTTTKSLKRNQATSEKHAIWRLREEVK